MNETLQICLRRQGTDQPLDAISPDGLVIDGETSAWPRRIDLNLYPTAPGTIEWLEQAQRRHDLERGHLPLAPPRLEGNCLVLEGLDPRALPPGRWHVGLRVAGLKVSPPQEVDLPPNGSARVSFSTWYRNRPLSVRIPAGWDPEIRRIVSASSLDGRSGIDWALNSAVRSPRRACLLNILAVCRELGLTDQIQEILLAEIDRIYARVEPALAESVNRLLTAEGPPEHPVHRKLLEWTPSPIQNSYRLCSYRQNRNPSLQVVVATSSFAGAPLLAEFDIDRGNPRNFIGFVIHAGEVLTPARTDHLKLYSLIKTQTGAGTFLAYQV